MPRPAPPPHIPGPIIRGPQPPAHGGPLDTIGATNQLLAEPWAGYFGARVKAAAEEVRASLEGKALARSSGKVGNNSYELAVTFKDVTADFAADLAPGFTQIPDFGAPSSGFSVAVPLTGAWHFRVNGNLALGAHVKVAGSDIADISAAAGVGLGLSGVRLRADGQMQGGDAAALPKLISVTLSPHIVLEGMGAWSFSETIDFAVTLQQGSITISKQVTNLSVGFGHDFDAKFEGEVRLVLRPSPIYTLRVGSLVKLTVATVETTFAFDGHLGVTLEHIGRVRTSFTIEASATLPAPGFLHDLVWMTAGRMPLPLQLESVDPPGVTPAPPGTDFAGVAADVWSALSAAHAPNGTVFSIEHRRPNEEVWGGRQFYCVEEDSALWTGHLLAAAAFRHAAAPSAEAHDMVDLALSGIERLFWVTQDAVVSPAAGGLRHSGVVRRRSAVGSEMIGIFARSALPDDSSTRWWEAEAAIQDGRCYYERPEDGWRVVPLRHSGPNDERRFATFEEAQKYVARTHVGGLSPTFPEVEIRPVGRVWTGLGCGARPTADHPVSRDQYAGVLLGLFAVFQLVDDTGLHDRAEKLLVPMLRHVIDNQFNVPLPPDQKTICTSYFGALDHQLAFLRVAKTVNPAEFGGLYDRVSAAAAACWIPLWLSALDPIAAYYKYNLTHAVLIPLLLAEGDATLRDQYLRTHRILRAATETHRNAYFDLASLLVLPPAQRTAAAQTRVSYSTLSLAEIIKSTLADWITRRTIVGEPNGLPADKTADPAHQAERWHHGAYTTESLDGGKLTLSNFALPIEQRPGGGRDYMWQRDPFQVGFDPHQPTPPTIAEVTKSDDIYREAPGVDYLLAYWLGVYLGVLPKPSA